MRLLGCLVLIGAFLLSGCQHNYVKDAQALQTAKICCDSYREFPYELAKLDEKKEFLLDEKAKAYTFPEGKRFFRSFKLPVWSGPYQVTISTSTMRGTGRESGVIKPVIRLLDDGFSESRVVRSDVDKNWMGTHFESKVFINESDSHERYLIIYPDEISATNGIKERQYSGIQAGHGVLLMPVTVGSVQHDYLNQFAPTGHVNIELKSYKPRKLGENDEQG